MNNLSLALSILFRLIMGEPFFFILILLFLIFFLAIVFKMIKLSYYVFRYGKIFSLKDFTMTNIALYISMLPFGQNTSRKIFQELSFDNGKPIEYFEQSIVKSRLIKTFKVVCCLGFLHVFVFSVIGAILVNGGLVGILLGSTVFCYYICFLYNPGLQVFGNILLYFVMLFPAIYMYFKNLYNIIKYMHYTKWQNVFHLLSLCFILFFPIVGLETYKDIIQNKLTFKPGFDEYYTKNISESKIVNLSFYSYGISCIAFFNTLLFLLSAKTFS
jgi:hypothetical protein